MPALPYAPYTFLPAYLPYLQYPPIPYPLPPEDELKILEDYKKELEEERASIEQEIGRVEARMRELRAMLGIGGKP
jgi:hypothetical protein